MFHHLGWFLDFLLHVFFHEANKLLSLPFSCDTAFSLPISWDFLVNLGNGSSSYRISLAQGKGLEFLENVSKNFRDDFFVEELFVHI